MREDLTDAKGEMTLTLNSHNGFINQHQEKRISCKGIRITNFKIAPKTSYDHGEDECVLLVDQWTSIENISPVCQQYNFIPNTSIKIILDSTKQYALGIIGAIVTVAKK